MIGSGVGPEEAGAMIDDTRRLNEERNPEKSASVSSSEWSNGSFSEEESMSAGSFLARLPHAWEAHRVYSRLPVPTMPVQILE